MKDTSTKFDVNAHIDSISWLKSHKENLIALLGSDWIKSICTSPKAVRIFFEIYLHQPSIISNPLKLYPEFIARCLSCYDDVNIPCVYDQWYLLRILEITAYQKSVFHQVIKPERIKQGLYDLCATYQRGFTKLSPDDMTAAYNQILFNADGFLYSHSDIIDPTTGKFASRRIEAYLLASSVHYQAQNDMDFDIVARHMDVWYTGVEGFWDITSKLLYAMQKPKPQQKILDVLAHKGLTTDLTADFAPWSNPRLELLSPT